MLSEDHTLPPSLFNIHHTIAIQVARRSPSCPVHLSGIVTNLPALCSYYTPDLSILRILYRLRKLQKSNESSTICGDRSPQIVEFGCVPRELYSCAVILCLC